MSGAVLRADLEQVSRRGWAEISEELYLDVGGVAAVTEISTDVMVGVGVSYPLHRVTKAKIASYGRLVRAAATQAASLIGPNVQ